MSLFFLSGAQRANVDAQSWMKFNMSEENEQFKYEESYPFGILYLRPEFFYLLDYVTWTEIFQIDDRNPTNKKKSGLKVCAHGGESWHPFGCGAPLNDISAPIM